MPNIWIARRTTVPRKALLLPMAGTKANPNLMFFLPGMDDQQLDQLVRRQLALQGVTKEGDVHAAVERAETEYERRRKTQEASAEVRRLMAIRAEGGTKRLVQVGFRKWREAFYRPNKGRYTGQP